MPKPGYVQSPEHIAKRVATTAARWATQGGPRPGRGLYDHPAGESASHWTGDDVGYKGAHDRARAAIRGLPCVHCGATSRVEAALIAGHGTKTDKQGRAYSPDPTDYMPLCKRCHYVYDGHDLASAGAATRFQAAT